MAVEDKYINANQAAGKLANPAFIQGANGFALVTTFEVAADDDDGSVYRLGTIPANFIPLTITLNCDAITAGTDYDMGLYKKGVGGAAKDADVFMDGTDISGGAAIGSGINCLSNVAITALVETMYEHAGDDVGAKDEGYDLAITANTVGTAAGTITVRAVFIQG